MPLNALPQLCVWDAVVCSVFSLAGRLPSMPSASGYPLLFGHFVGTVRPSDFPSTCMLDFWITSFSNRPAHDCVSGVDGTSRRSEEHTSELQSRLHLVCRLLLENKKHT